MAVYTAVDRNAADALAEDFGIGEVVEIAGILQGVENSNYRLVADRGRFILTIFEKRVEPGDVPFFLALMAHLAGRGVPCPVPVETRSGARVTQVSGKPAAIVSFLPGTAIDAPTPTHCEAVGRLLARIHLETRDFPLRRANALSLAGCASWLARAGDDADRVRPGLGAELAGELAALERAWPRDLPAGVIHGDLFPDNVFFTEGAVSGVIDFYFAADDFFAYDLAICIDAWCFGADGRLDPERSAALLQGYRSLRRLSDEELAYLPILCRGSSLRFIVTRLYDWLNTAEDAHVRRKDPLEFLERLQWHRTVRDAASYGA